MPRRAVCVLRGAPVEGAVRCFACGGPYHEATGHAWRGFDDVAYCGPCYRRWLVFFKSHTKRKWNKGDFYAEAATSIRAT